MVRSWHATRGDIVADGTVVVIVLVVIVVVTGQVLVHLTECARRTIQRPR